jgi:glycerophosphoryl diester phosphodiesterase
MHALDDGAAGIELDVRLASDGVPVVIHDATLQRTGLREGVVAKMTSDELRLVTVGTWFNQSHPELARSEYGSQCIPTLAQVFDLFTQSSIRPELIYVELKTDQGEDTYRDLTSAVVQLIDEYHFHSRVVVVSFNLPAIAQIKTIDASIRTGALFEPRRNAVKVVRKHPLITAALECGADQILFHRLIATWRLIDLASDNNLRSVVWTVDDPKWLRRRVSFEIHAVITNNPARLIADF